MNFYKLISNFKKNVKNIKKEPQLDGKPTDESSNLM